MLTKYILTIAGEEYQLSDEDLRNWDEIQVSYKRSELDGVVRSFSSEFVFVGRAKDLLWRAYCKSGVNTDASVTVYVWTNNWGWEKKFSCPFDFSTLQLENFELRLNCLDSSIEALVKANKGTKYEFEIGKDIIPDSTLAFDRLPMIESVTYEFTDGVSYDGIPDILVDFERDSVPWVGNVGSEIAINGVLYFADDQEGGEDSYTLKAVKDCEVTADFALSWRSDEETVGHTNGQVASVGVSIVRNGEVVGGSTLVQFIHSGYYLKVGEYYYRGALESAYPNPGTLEYPERSYAVVDGIVYVPRYTGSRYEWEDTGQTVEERYTESGSGTATLQLKAGDRVVVTGHHSDPLSQHFFIRFISQSMKFTWKAEGSAVEIDLFRPLTVVRAIFEKITGLPNGVEISSHDPRLADTYIMAAESARGIPGAKLYTSFTEFCDWMSVVFGYVGRMKVWPNGVSGYSFQHRSELFKADAETRKLEYSTGHSYNINSSLLFSTLTIGYENKSYDSVNGRDEFNFNHTYATGCKVSDSTLTMTSKYRADSYGIEFAVQKRGKDTTDSATDQDVFFLLCANKNGLLVPDRSMKIEGTVSDRVFNGAFSPRECVLANMGYLAVCTDSLQFASSTGNSEIVIDGYRMNAAIRLSDPLVSYGELSFVTDNVDDIADVDELVEVTDIEGVRYRGFIKEVDLKYARTAAAQYKLIVKEIE